LPAYLDKVFLELFDGFLEHGDLLLLDGLVLSELFSEA
jgi:hypothetical protein